MRGKPMSSRKPPWKYHCPGRKPEVTLAMEVSEFGKTGEDFQQRISKMLSEAVGLPVVFEDCRQDYSEDDEGGDG